MATGRISKIQYKKGFGFIIDNENYKSFFFHFSGLSTGLNPKELFVGKYVSYDFMENNKGTICVNIRNEDNDDYDNDDYDNDDYDNDDYDNDDYDNRNSNVWYDSNIQCGHCGGYKTIEKNGYCKCLLCGFEGYCN